MEVPDTVDRRPPRSDWLALVLIAILILAWAVLSDAQPETATELYRQKKFPEAARPGSPPICRVRSFHPYLVNLSSSGFVYSASIKPSTRSARSASVTSGLKPGRHGDHGESPLGCGPQSRSWFISSTNGGRRWRAMGRSTNEGEVPRAQGVCHRL